MKVAVGILCLVLSLALFMQSCTLIVGSSLAEDELLRQESAIGVLAAFALLLGGAFSFQMPRTAAGILLVGGLIALATEHGQFTDLPIWGGALLVLAVLAFFGGRRKAVA